MPQFETTRLARQLILDELFDLTLYRELQKISSPELRNIFEKLIPIETKHLNFWQDFFGIRIARLNGSLRIKLGILIVICRLFGATAIHVILEAIEIHGVRKYLSVWKTYKDQPLGEAVREILKDEFEHEDVIVSEMAKRRINPERIRSMFLGFNDGLVEMLGAVSGFFAAFENPAAILTAGLMVSVAGSLSMGAGAYAASSSEEEIQKIQRGKAQFLNASFEEKKIEEAPWVLAFIVGASYFLGASIAILPVFFGARTIFLPLVSAGTMIVLISSVLSFLSGMELRRRILMNLLLATAAVGISFSVGMAVKSIFGVSL